MDLMQVLLLSAVGLVGGILSTMLGGASIVTFPALVATGLSPVAATAVNQVALTPGAVAAVYWDRSQLPPADRWLVALVVLALVGATIGGLLLAITPVRVFAALVPLLLGFATVLFAYSGSVASWLDRQSRLSFGGGKSREIGSLGLVFLVSLYAGYFGAGAGVLLVGVLSIGMEGDYRAINARKNLVSAVNCLVICVVYTWAGIVVWLPTVIMAVTALYGSYLGVLLARIVSREAMRVVIIGASALLTLAFAWRYWL